MRFGARLAAAIADRGQLCVGIDPHPQLLAQWELTDDSGGLRRFADICVDAFAGQVSIIKPQSAFFERHGSAGIAVLENLIKQLRTENTLVLLDAKRGDIGSTMSAYAQAYLADNAPLAVDAITLSPYLGFDSLRPAIDTAIANNRGIFALALTSNPEAAASQQAVLADGRGVAQTVLDGCAAHNRGVAPLGDCGVVIGATLPELSARIDQLNGPILAPGLGAQGATIASLRRLFGNQFPAVIAVSARDILRHGPDPQHLRAAALAQNELLASTGDAVRS